MNIEAFRTNLTRNI